MKPPRVTIRNLMVGIIGLAFVMAIPGWLRQRQVHFEYISEYHLKEADLLIDKYHLAFRKVNYVTNEELEALLQQMGPDVSVAAKLVNYHWKMAKKYNHLKNYPWYFASEDPPKPKTNTRK